MSEEAMETLNEHGSAEEARPIRLHAVRLQLCDVLEKAGLWRPKRSAIPRGWGRG